jgi:hypothetical protein
MGIRTAIILIVVCTACQSGKIPCPEIKFAKIKESKANRGNRFMASPARMMASAKTMDDRATPKREVNLERLKATRTTGKEMLEQYGNVEEWDCPSPAGKKKYSKLVKENIRKNEKKMREHLKRTESDTLTVMQVSERR